MTERKKVTVSLYPEDIEKLQWIADACAMTASETIRQMIKKSYVDKTNREILVKNSLREKTNKGKKGFTSHNVQDDTKKEDDTTTHYEAPSKEPSSGSFSSLTHDKAGVEYWLNYWAQDCGESTPCEKCWRRPECVHSAEWAIHEYKHKKMMEAL